MLVSLQDKIETTLRASRLFAHWPQDALAPLRKAADFRRYVRGETIAEREDPVCGLWIVASGSVTCHRSTPNGKYFLESIFWPGSVVGLTPAIDGWPMPFSHMARRDCQVVFVPRAAFLAATRESGRMEDVVVFMALRARVGYESVFTICAESLSVRVAKFLAYLPRRSLFVSEGPPGSPGWIDPAPIDLTQDELAAMLGISRQTLNRALGPFLRSGIVVRDGDMIRVVNFRKLLAVMEENEKLPEIWRNEILSWDEHLRADKADAKFELRDAGAR